MSEKKYDHQAYLDAIANKVAKNRRELRASSIKFAAAIAKLNETEARK